jgi:hypothetical protein
MSLKVSKSIVLSEKFNKEVEKFFEWANLMEYVPKFKDDESRDWTFSLVKIFTEPSRNKLEMYISAIMDNHSITSDESKICDAKLMVKDFKENSKIKKVKVIKKVTNEEKIKKITKEEKIKKTQSNCSDIKNLLLCDVNTTDTWYLCELETSTEILEQVFNCKAKKTGQKNDDFQYEWKFEMDDSIYSVYNWAWEDGSFDDYEKTTWYLAGNNEDKRIIVKIKEFCDNKKLEMEELFGEDYKDKSVEVEKLFSTDEDENENEIDWE